MKTYAIDNGEDYSDHDISFFELPDDVTREDLEALNKIFKPNYHILFVSKNIEWFNDEATNQWCDSVYNQYSGLPSEDQLKSVHTFFLERSLKDIEDTIEYNKEAIERLTANKKDLGTEKFNEYVTEEQRRMVRLEEVHKIISQIIAERRKSS